MAEVLEHLSAGDEEEVEHTIVELVESMEHESYHHETRSTRAPR